MDFKDYYKILGVDKTSSAEDIKKAYRKLAVKYHPDKNQGNKQAEEKFKEANEANEILGNPEKRKKYDELGANWKQYENQAGQGAGQGRYQQQGGQRYYNSENEGFEGAENFSDFFESYFGGSFGSQGGQKGRRSQSGSDYEAEVQLSLEEVYTGTSRMMEVNGEKLQMKFKGVQDGQKLRIKGKGGQGINGGARGDIYVNVHIAPHSHFERKGDDLYCEAPVELYTAILGGKSPVRTMKSTIKIDIAKETDNGKTLRLKGVGMPKFGKENEFGDLYAKVKIILPKKLSVKEIELFEQLSQLKLQNQA